MDVKTLREQARSYLDGSDFPIDNDVPREFIRILDAFELLRKARVQVELVGVGGSEAFAVTCGQSQLSSSRNLLKALLAAAQTLEGKTDGLG